MFNKSLSLAGALMIAGASMANAAAHGAPVMAGTFEGETYLVDSNKMALYTFDKDAEGVSNCYDDCAVKWPPLAGEMGMALPDGFTVIERKDGTAQIAYKGQPLYLWFKDQNPGDTTGDGVKGVWHTARP